MKTQPSLLTPFVRSDAVGAILAETLGRPDREVSLAELGRLTGVSGPVVHREVQRLVAAGVLRDRTEGRNRLVRAETEHPLYPHMREIIEGTYGPIPVIREEFEGLEGVQKLLIYGSWAARRAGQPGRYPNDIDVLVVGSSPRRGLFEAATLAGDRLEMDVNITRIDEEEWEAGEPSPFVSTVKSRPLVDVSTGEVYV